jgi:two-component system sensor histidine kinase KdpD
LVAIPREVGCDERVKPSGRRYSKRVGVLLGIGLLVVIGAMVYPFRAHDYELQLLLVLPVVFAGALSGRTAALVTAVPAVVMFHYVTQAPSERITLGEDAIALGTFLASALAVGIAVGNRADRLEAAAQREEERRVNDLLEQVAAKESRVTLLEQIDQQRAALLRSISHDLRSPLATITAVASDLRDDDDVDVITRHELLDTVSDEAQRLDRLVGNLLNMSRIHSGSLRVEAQPVDMGEIVNVTAIRLRRVFTDVQLHVEIPPALALVDGDPVLLEQVVSNLLVNAATYAPPGSTVTTQLCSHGRDEVVLRVTDHGAGVRDEDVEHLFEPFWKGPASRSSGLGLAIVKAVVDAHRGSITVTDTPGGGATFEVHLPARCDESYEVTGDG